MFISHKSGLPEMNNKDKKVLATVIPTFEEEIPEIEEDYNEETLLSEINKFLEEDTCEEEESMGEDY